MTGGNSEIKIEPCTFLILTTLSMALALQFFNTVVNAAQRRRLIGQCRVMTSCSAFRISAFRDEHGRSHTVL